MARGRERSAGTAARVPHRRGDGPRPSNAATVTVVRSPQAWGWPDLGACFWPSWSAFPTGVGMARTATSRRATGTCVPHRRGDGPASARPPQQLRMRSPQAWGWPAQGARDVLDLLAFPTGVGMARTPHRCNFGTGRVPHRRGDGPAVRSGELRPLPRSPQVWGWPGAALATDARREVFPTGVGMARRPNQAQNAAPGVPHRCGDGPIRGAMERGLHLCSPQVWGWPAIRHRAGRGAGVFPTGVGMARFAAKHSGQQQCVPHRCGDGPTLAAAPRHHRWCSPQVWGWPASCPRCPRCC